MTKRLACFTVFFGSVTGLFWLTSQTAFSQGGGGRGSVALQSVTPGFSQSGHTNISGTSRAGGFVGNGEGISGLNASNLAIGTVPDARLSSNVAKLGSAQTFTGDNVFAGGLTIPSGAQNGHVLTSSASGAATWLPPSFALPFDQGISLPPSFCAFQITATGGTAICGIGNNTGVSGQSTGNGPASFGVVGSNSTSNSWGYLGRVDGGVLGTATGTRFGVKGTSVDGYGVAGTSATGIAGYFESSGNNPTTTIGVVGRAGLLSGTGIGGKFESNNLNPSSVGVQASGYVGVGASGVSFGGSFGTFSGVAVYGESGNTGIKGLTHFAGSFGGHFTAEGAGSTAAYAFANDTGSANRGVHGISAGSSGVGVRGEATSAAGSTFGGEFISVSDSGMGVVGRGTATTGSPYGVYGKVAAQFGYGVFGENGANGGFGIGVQGLSTGSGGHGVWGISNAVSGLGTGVRGASVGTNGTGVFGEALGSAATNYGGLFRTNSAVGFSVAMEGGVGAILRNTTNFTSLLIQSGKWFGADNLNRATIDIPGVIGDVLVWDNLHISNTMTAGGKFFRIDHPLDPHNKVLSHSCIESNEMKNLYDGEVVTDAKGYGSVTVPDWFLALNENFRYQLTVADDSDDFVMAKVTNELSGTSFTLRTSKPNVKVFWQVTGVRKDAYAKANPIRVEEDKPAGLKGRLIHPEAFGSTDPIAAHLGKLASDSMNLAPKSAGAIGGHPRR